MNSQCNFCVSIIDVLYSKSSHMWPMLVHWTITHFACKDLKEVSVLMSTGWYAGGTDWIPKCRHGRWNQVLKEVALQKRVADCSCKQLYQWTGSAQDESQMERSREFATLAECSGVSANWHQTCGGRWLLTAEIKRTNSSCADKVMGETRTQFRPACRKTDTQEEIPTRNNGAGERQVPRRSPTSTTPKREPPGDPPGLSGLSRWKLLINSKIQDKGMRRPCVFHGSIPFPIHQETLPPASNKCERALALRFQDPDVETEQLPLPYWEIPTPVL